MAIYCFFFFLLLVWLPLEFSWNFSLFLCVSLGVFCHRPKSNEIRSKYENFLRVKCAPFTTCTKDRKRLRGREWVRTHTEQMEFWVKANNGKERNKIENRKKWKQKRRKPAERERMPTEKFLKNFKCNGSWGIFICCLENLKIDQFDSWLITDIFAV